MKDIVLFESASARQRRGKHLQALLAIHQSDQLPPELLKPVRRKIRWKAPLRLMLAVDFAMIVFCLCFCIWFWAIARQAANTWTEEVARGERALRWRIEQAVEPAARDKADRAIQEYEEQKAQFRRLEIVILTNILLFAVVFPIVYVVASWFRYVRPELLVLRTGRPARATITRCAHWLGIMRRIEFGFTTEQGAYIRRTQLVGGFEYPLFVAGDSVWVLYLPTHPKRAMVYGLKHQLAELTMGD